MKSIIAFIILSTVKIISRFLYRHETKFLDNSSFKNFENVKIIAVLNHTSLFEPLFLASVPFPLIWEFSKHAVGCGADITLNRPIIGFFWRFLLPDMVSITRKRDATWDHFIQKIQAPKSIIFIAPEGRMMREPGLDKHGKPMSVRGGIVDVIENVHFGELVLLYSGGLHHVHKPGDLFPRPFKTIKLNIERVQIPLYKATYATLDSKARKKAIVQDLESRLKQHRPR
jgi:1-acyl-sn-glycerol-3-phosphate acyltransferase